MSISVNRRPVLKPIIDDTPFKPIPVEQPSGELPKLEKPKDSKRANVNLFS